jgi:hypothetical protein
VQSDTAGIYVWSTYGYFTTAVPSPPYVLQTPQYFVDIRGNSMHGQLGGAGNPGNAFGAGIALPTLSGTLLDGVPQPNPNLPGFGVSISRNTLSDVASPSFGLCEGAFTAIAIAPFQAADQSSSPGWLDTLVFANVLTGTKTSAGLPYSSAILNGCYDGEPNYPRGTVLCGNQFGSFASLVDDWPPPGAKSTLSTACGE